MRRTLRIVALVGTLLIGVLALALIVSQTPWFKDWLRQFAVRQAAQYVNGTITIGSLGGNLFTGVELGDIGIDVNGERVITLKQVEVKYSIGQLTSQGVTVESIRLEQPFVLLRRDATGWNIAKLVKRQEREANRQGPSRSVSLPSIEIVDARVQIDDRKPSGAYTLPRQIQGLNIKAGYEYAPVHYSVTLDRVQFSASEPSLVVKQLSGRIGTREDNLHLEKLSLKTADSGVVIDGAINNYLKSPSLQLTVTSPLMSLPEFSAVVPALRGYDLHPSFDVKANGRQDSLRLDVTAKSEAGNITGTLAADALSPNYAARGDVAVEHLDLAPLLKSPRQKSDITGQAKLDLNLPSAPAGAPVLERLRGRVAFQGPRVVAAGYTASNVRATADLNGRRIGIDARANAYGGSATAKGMIVTASAPGQPTRIDLAGSASRVNLASLPRSLNVSHLNTNINATSYRVTGSIGRVTYVSGSATLAPSNVAGATILSGTTGEFALSSVEGRRGLQSLSYTAKGEVHDLNLQSVGNTFQIAALAKPEYDSRINTTFDVKGSGTVAESMTIDGAGVASDSRLLGGTLPRLAYEVHLANNGLSGRATGEFQRFDPGRLAANPRFNGQVSGTVDGSFGIGNLSAPITPDAVTADGRITLAKSEIAGLAIESADVQGQYANRRGHLRQATVKGPAVDVQASGDIALDRAGQSNLKYRAVTTDLAALGKLANQEGLNGAATIEGTLTGNAESLKVTGTLDGAKVAYKDNKALDLNSKYTVTIPELTVANANVQAETTGTFVQIGAIEISTLTATTTYERQTLKFQTHLANIPSGASPQGARELDATGDVVFHPEHQELHLPSLSLRTQGVEWRTAPGAEATVKYAKDRVELINVRLMNANQILNVDGVFALGETARFEGIKVHAENVDIAQLEKLALMNRGLAGTLNADATITGTAKAPAVAGHVDVAGGAFQQFKYQSLVADGSFSNNRIGLDARLVQSPGVELTAKGTLPLSALRADPPGTPEHVTTVDDPIDLRIQSSRIDLAIIQGFTNQVSTVTGTVQADVRVTGSGRDPHLDGYVDLQNGAFVVPQAGVSFSGLTTRIELEADRIRVPKFQVLDENQRPLTIEGELATHERSVGAVNISIESNDFKLVDNELGELHLESHLKLTGELRKPRLEGELRTDAARLELDRILLLFSNPYSEEALPDVISAQDTVTSDKGADQATRDALARGREIGAAKASEQNATAPEAPAPKTGLFSTLEMDIHFVAPDNLVVRGDDIRPGAHASNVGSMNATLGTDLTITKAANGPVTLRGNANTVRGFYEFQGRRFTIARGGTLRFLGLPDLNPNLDVTAERVIPNTGVTAILHVTGSARSPQLALSSTPPLDEADILSLIVFNRSVNELGTGERASLAETAGGIASGFVASSLGKSIGRALDVDLFEITTSDPDTGETAGGVTVGKQVGDKAFVRFRQQFGQRSFTEFMLEYQLAKFLRLDTRISPETSGVANRLTQRRTERAGVDLIFFFSY